MALLALAYIQPADAFKRARELLSTHTNWTDKLDLYYIIGQAGTPEALSFLRKQAADGDDNDKRAADGTLAELKKAKATTRPVLPPASQPA